VHTLANLVRLFSAWREQLHTELDTNPHCRRLAPLPEALVNLADTLLDGGSGGSSSGGWRAVAKAAAGTGLTKYADINLTALVTPRPAQDTVEIRLLPGSIDTATVIGRAWLVERLIDRCTDPRPIPHPRPGDRLDHLLVAALR
jgi:hypothetical protein